MNKPELHDLVSALKTLATEKGRTPSFSEFKTKCYSGRQVNKLADGYANLCKLAGLEPNKTNFGREADIIETRKARVLFFDIETAPIQAHVWGLFDQNIGLNQITEDWFILSYAAKFQGEDNIHYIDQRYAEPMSDDRQLLEGIHHLLSECDVIVGHNSDRFDLKKLNARFIRHGFSPLPPKKQIDTLKIAKKYFSFTSNKLEYIARFLGKDEKLKHNKFSGHSLWMECLKRNIEAFDEMELYNKQDVIVLEQVYNELIKYDHSISLSSIQNENVCTCGSKLFFKDGYRYTKTGKFQLFRCSECGKITRSRDNLLIKDYAKRYHV